jgi:hypothetical protein
VRHKEVLLAPEQRLLSTLRWIERAIPSNDRWYTTFQRYVRQVAMRVDGLGGDSTAVTPSPSGDWETPGPGPGPTTPGSVTCRSFAIALAALLAMLVILLGIGTSAVQIVLAVLVVVLLAVVGHGWVTTCRPSIGRLLMTLGLGLVAGVILLLLLRAGGP